MYGPLYEINFPTRLTMTVRAISSAVTPQQIQPHPITEAVLRNRIQLHTTDSMERAKSVKTDSGAMALPTQSPEQRETLRELYTKADGEQQLKLAQATAQLAQVIDVTAADANLSTNMGALTEAVGTAAEIVTILRAENEGTNAINDVMLMAYDGISSRVMDLAGELKGNLDQTKELREILSDFREELSEDWAEGEMRDFTYFEDHDGEYVLVTKSLSREDAKLKMEEMEGYLANMGDVKQDFQFRLQMAMQQQQQAMQIMSNISKMIHDTAKAIIQNLRA